MKTKLSKQKIIDNYFGTLINYYIATIRLDRKITKPKRIIIYKLDAIGDSILCLPMIKHLKKETKARIIVACSKNNLEVFQNHKFIDKIVEFDSSKFNPKNIIDNLKILKEEKADVAIDGGQSSNISAIFSWLTAKNTIGFKKTKAKSRNKVYNHPINLDPNKHIVYCYMDLLSPLGINSPKKIKLISLYQNKFPIRKNIIGIHPCNILPYKAWPQEKWIKIIKYLTLNYDVTIIGSKEESKMVKELLKKVKSKRIIDLSGKTNIKELINILPNFKLFIGNDGGPMHIAASMNIKTIGLFGPETPVRYAPFNKNSIALYNPTNCSPCIKTYANKNPGCEEVNCMKKISIEDVKEAINKLL